MKVILVKDYEEMSTTAAEMIATFTKSKPEAVLSFATGSTPIGTYEKLVSFHKLGLDFSQVSAFHLDEYIGLSPDDPNSYAYYLDENLFSQLNIPSENIHLHNSDPHDIESHAHAYDTEIEDCGGIDIQILGVGENGHIAFLEPDDKLQLETGRVKLSENTIEVNARFFEDPSQVPKEAISLGLRSIFRARKIIFLINGVKKHNVVKRLLEDPNLDTRFPASVLLMHNDCTLIVDEEAYTGKPNE